jgi:hypothetical protein
VLAEIVAGVYVFNTRDTIATNLQKEMNLTLPKYSKDETVKRSWDALQHDVSISSCRATGFLHSKTNEYTDLSAGD